MSVYIEQKKYQNNVTPQNSIKREKPSLFALAGSILKACAKEIYAWNARSHQRNELSQLNDRMLADIGCTPEQARREFEKPFWK